MYGCMDAWMHGCMDAWMHGCMDACMYVRTYVCIYISWIMFDVSLRENHTLLLYGHCVKSQSQHFQDPDLTADGHGLLLEAVRHPGP